MDISRVLIGAFAYFLVILLLISLLIAERLRRKRNKGK
jgi:hypothetical protein